MSEIGAEQRLALERAVADDPGAPGFAALAELRRRAGRLAEAGEILRRGLERDPDTAGGRLVWALWLLDRGLAEQAHAALEPLADDLLAAHRLSAPGPAQVTDSEFDAAFADVETDLERIVDPNRVAAEAVSIVDGPPEHADPPLLESLEGSAFATATMAELLERQGDRDGAARVRAAVAARAPSVGKRRTSDTERRQRTIATLQRWLGNLRGERS